MKSMTAKAPVGVIIRRELGAYFASPIAYIVTCLFLLFSGFVFFSTFFISQMAELRRFFEFLPILFSFFIPAITMRMFSEEKRSGSFETLLTLPVSTLDVVMGKYIAALISSLVMLVPTVFYAITCMLFGSPDMGTIVGGYIGSILLSASYTAIGLFASSITKNQIIAFFTSFSICIVLSLLNNFAVIFPGAIVSLVNFISASSHFESVSRGIVDSRDIIYFLSLTLAFFALTVRTIENSRKG